MAGMSRWEAEKEVRFIKALRSQLEATVDDELAIKDTIEGETDANAALEILLQLRTEYRGMERMRKTVAARYADMAREDEVRAGKIEDLILECLQAAGMDKWTGIHGTVSLRRGSVKTAIIDPNLLPLQYMKPVPNIAAIKEALQQGDAVPGAELVRGEQTLQIKPSVNGE